MKTYIQNLGRALMLPVATLPAAALFLGIGYWIDPDGWGGNNLIAAFLVQAGAAILDNLGILFAVGVAVGMAKDKSGAAGLAGLVGFLTVTTIMGQAATFLAFEAEEAPAAFAPGAIGNKNVFFGILVGCIAGALYNRFAKTKLPDFLAFFSGRRSVPILTAAVMSVVSIALLFIWPILYNALVYFGESVMSMGAVGAGIYGFFNRLLIPTGLHHALNNVFWFNLAGIDDITKFWTGFGGVSGTDAAVVATGGFHPFGTYVTGMYQAGFFPVMMFGLPAGAFAIYRAARPEKRKQVGSLMLAAGLAAFLTGVTEPIEFAFMFAAFPLYIVHALLTGLSLFIAAAFQWIAGFQFSGGFIDWFLSLRVPRSHMPFMLILQGIVFAVLYYTIFTWMIKTFNLKTPGREDDSEDGESIDSSEGEEDRDTALATKIYKALGGKENIQDIDHCTTRLRLVLKNTDIVNESALKNAPVAGTNKIDEKNYQVIIGPHVQAIYDALVDIYENAPAEQATNTELYAPVSGLIKDITTVDDPAFAQKQLGDGFAVEPQEDSILSPVSGTVISVAATQHAIGIRTDKGEEILVHVGINTVALGKEAFSVHVEKNQKIHAGESIITADLEKIKEAGYPSDVIVVVLKPKNAAIKIEATGTVEAGSYLGQCDSSLHV